MYEAFFRMCCQGDIKTCKNIYNYYPKVLYGENNNNKNCLVVSCHIGDLKLFKWLYEIHYKQYLTIYNQKDIVEPSELAKKCLIICCEYGFLDILQYLFTICQIKNIDTILECHLFKICCQRDRSDICDWLFNFGSDHYFSYRDSDGKSHLDWCCTCCSQKVIKLFIEKGYQNKFITLDNNCTPMYKLLYKSNIKSSIMTSIKELIISGIFSNKTTPVEELISICIPSTHYDYFLDWSNQLIQENHKFRYFLVGTLKSNVNGNKDGILDKINHLGHEGADYFKKSLTSYIDVKVGDTYKNITEFYNNLKIKHQYYNNTMLSGQLLIVY